VKPLKGDFGRAGSQHCTITALFHRRHSPCPFGR
jgi:hypothetical protein